VAIGRQQGEAVEEQVEWTRASRSREERLDSPADLREDIRSPKVVGYGRRDPGGQVDLARELQVDQLEPPRRLQNLALELAPIRVNLIAAGFVDTPGSAAILGDQLDARREQLRTTLPIGRVVGPATSPPWPST
jgi:hypothetical protein